MAIDCFAALEPHAELRPHTYEPPPLGPFDVELQVTHCGICHSDIHLIDNDWGISQYPLVPGHEVVGTVRARGTAVRHLAEGQRVGVGWQSGSCLECEWCRQGAEPCCPQQQATCVARPGGFGRALHLDSRFAHPIPDALSSADAAPLLCAGITVFAPLRAEVQPGARVGVIGIGGLGHLGLQFARAMGCEVTAFSTSRDKEDEARQFGAHHFIVSRDADAMARAAGSLDYVLSTVTVPLHWPTWLNLLRPKGTIGIVGASPGTLDLAPMDLIVGQKAVRGSAIGWRFEMHEMLRFAALHGIRARSETLPMSEVNAAVARVRANQARYRVVLANT